jgi:sRNA-binding regulator protein Hfq
MSRKLIKPNLEEIRRSAIKKKKKPPPAYKTHAENYYYLKQMNNKTPMLIELVNDEIIEGYIGWYDQYCIKVKKHDGTKIILFKHFIKYLQKDEERIDKEDSEG